MTSRSQGASGRSESVRWVKRNEYTLWTGGAYRGQTATAPSPGGAWRRAALSGAERADPPPDGATF